MRVLIGLVLGLLLGVGSAIFAYPFWLRHTPNSDKAPIIVSS
jgi:hypothetical protein